MKLCRNCLAEYENQYTHCPYCGRLLELYGMTWIEQTGMK